MGRQTTDHTARYWRRIPWATETFPEQYHAAWKPTGWPLCNASPDYRLSDSEYLEVGPGIDFTQTDRRICPKCKRLADELHELIEMEPHSG